MQVVFCGGGARKKGKKYVGQHVQRWWEAIWILLGLVEVQMRARQCGCKLYLGLAQLLICQQPLLTLFSQGACAIVCVGCQLHQSHCDA